MKSDQKCTPWKINMEPENGWFGIWKMIFLFNWVIFRFHVNLSWCIGPWCFAGQFLSVVFFFAIHTRFDVLDIYVYP